MFLNNLFSLGVRFVWLILRTYFTIQFIFAIIYGPHYNFWYYS